MTDSDQTERLRFDPEKRRLVGTFPRSQVIDERTGLTGYPATGPRIVADFEFDVDEFLRIIYEGRKE